MLIAGPNLTIDRTSRIELLRPGQVARLEEVVVTPGGKGLNVARTARALGRSAELVSLIPGHTGRAVAALVEEEEVALRAVPVDGEIRVTAIVLERDGRTTVLNEPGPRLGPAGWAAYEAAVRAGLDAHGWLVCSGSVPPGSPADAYGRLVELARDAGTPALVDAAGAGGAPPPRPDLVCPNLAEAEALLTGTDAGEDVEAAPDARPRALAAAQRLCRRGASAAVVTAAGAGAALAEGTGATSWLAAPEVEVANPVGAGDAFAGGLAAALEAGEALPAAVRRAVAVGAASVEHPTAGMLDPERALVLEAGVRVERGQRTTRGG